MLYFDILLVISGILFLLSGVYISYLQIKIIQRIYKISKEKNILYVIYTLYFVIILISFFIMGYSIQLYVLNPNWDFLFFLNKDQKLWIALHHEQVITFVYFGGSLFVLIVNLIFYNNLKQFLNVSYSKDYLQTILNASNNYIIITDKDYNIKEVNKIFLERFSAKKEDLIGKNIFSIMSFDQDNLQHKDYFPYLCSFNN
jgi:PAS domain-containing protein